MVNCESEKYRAEQSNPFSTGGGGVNYEISVQSYFVASMLLEWKIPDIKADNIVKIKLQGRYDGYNTDDCILWGNNGNKMLCQIKHSIAITKSDETLKEVINSGWYDFNNTELFNVENDCIEVIVSQLSKKDNDAIRSIHDWSKTCEDEKEFIQKIYTSKFSSENKKNKFEVIKNHLLNIKNNITDKEIWQFLKIFNIRILDVESQESYIKSSFMSALNKLSREDNFGQKLYCYVAESNQNAATITLDQIRDTLNIGIVEDYNKLNRDREKLNEHTKLVLQNMRNDVAGVTIERNEELEEINKLLENNQMILITGERGVGKSGIAKRIWEKYCTDKYVVAMRAEEFNYPSVQNVFSNIGIESKVSDIFSVFSLYNEKIFFIESLEKILELEDNRAFIDLLTIISKNPEWKIIATTRKYAIQQIIMNFISEHMIKHQIVNIQAFTENEIEEFIKKRPEITSIRCNKEILELIRNPFYLLSVYKILSCGYILNKEDNKNTIKKIIWEEIIKKQSERKDGLPYKRENNFIKIALKRSKTMMYAVSTDGFDENAISKLEEDGLIVSKEGLIYLTHDIFEDWAIERYIEKEYILNKNNIAGFLENIGCEQSMCRAYRLWLNEKDDDFINSYITELFNTSNLKSIWYDETMAAIIFSNRIYNIFSLLEEKLFINNCELLKRLCFIIRVTAKTPNTDFWDDIQTEYQTKKSALLVLKPYGESWKYIIKFLYEHREKLPSNMYIHCLNILKEWTSIININTTLPEEAKEAGLLALFIIKEIKDDYNERDMIKKLFSIAIMTYESISNDVDVFLEETVFNNNARQRHNYIDDIAEETYNSIHTGFIAKRNPDILIRIAKREFLEKEQPPRDTNFSFGFCSDLDENNIYGLTACTKNDYFPASGEREPFRSLFKFYPKKAVDFVLEICNITAETYVKKQLDRCNDKQKEEFLKQITYKIKKEDGTIIKQYGTGNFWGAYRGFSTVPYLISSALMALENYLIKHFEDFKENRKEIDYCFEYIISNSNSVLTTAVLSSVAIPFYKNLGKNVLLLLQNNDFFDIDISRMAHEMGEHEPNWFVTNNDILRKFYIEDRKKAATRTWRKESLESLAVKLQFTELKLDVWKIIDDLNKKNKNLIDWNFRINKIDIRKFKFELDEENNQIICKSKEITDKKLLQIAEKNNKKASIMNRFFKITHWVREAKNGNYDFSEHKDIKSLIKEVKSLIIIYNELKTEEKSIFYMVEMIECISIIYIKFKEDLNLDEKKWCKDFILKEFYEYDKKLNNITINGRVDNTGLWIAAECFSCICEEMEEKDQKKLLIQGLTCCDLDIRLHTAIGIGKYLWGINGNLAKACMDLVDYFDTLDTKGIQKYRTILYENNKKKDNYLDWLKTTRKKLLKITDFSKFISNKGERSLYSVTEKMLMLPKKYDYRMDSIILGILDRVILAEKDKNNYRKEDKGSNECYYEVLQYYTDFFSKYFYQMEQSQLKCYLELMEKACNNAPSFMKYTLINYRWLATKNKEERKYWTFFNMISDIMIEVSNELMVGENYKYDKRNELLSEYIYLNTIWQSGDFENPPLKNGIYYICEFARKTDNNVLVFEGICSLMYYFPKLILNEGLKTFERLSEDDIKRNLEKGRNSIFYLENILHYYVINLENNAISRDMYNICEKFLNVLVECASSKAYYTREYLIKSKKIM